MTLKAGGTGGGFVDSEAMAFAIGVVGSARYNVSIGPVENIFRVHDGT